MREDAPPHQGSQPAGALLAGFWGLLVACFIVLKSRERPAAAVPQGRWSFCAGGGFAVFGRKERGGGALQYAPPYAHGKEHNLRV